MELTAGPGRATSAFLGRDQVDGISTLASGHIHRSWVLSARGARFLLQELNRTVFADIDALMVNTVRIGDHLRATRMTSPEVVRTTNGDLWWEDDDDGSAWRVFEFLEGVRPAEPIGAAAEAEEVGWAYGRFAARLVDLPGPALTVTLPGMHDLATRWAHCQAVAGGPELEAAAAHSALADGLDGLPVRIAHGDAKAGNVLLDHVSGITQAVVDLDTTGPAALLVDAGDLIRSATCRAAEDEADLRRVVFEPELFGAVTGGWLGELRDVLTGEEVDRVVTAGQAICWEQAVRFLTDHYEGDRYYRVTRPHHNLDRARTQLRLLQQLVDRQADLEVLVARAWTRRRPVG